MTLKIPDFEMQGIPFSTIVTCRSRAFNLPSMPRLWIFNKGWLCQVYYTSSKTRLFARLLGQVVSLDNLSIVSQLWMYPRDSPLFVFTLTKTPLSEQLEIFSELMSLLLIYWLLLAINDLPKIPDSAIQWPFYLLHRPRNFPVNLNIL